MPIIKRQIALLLILCSSLFAEGGMNNALHTRSSVQSPVTFSENNQMNSLEQIEPAGDYPRFNVYTSIGIYEMLQVGLGYNIDENWGVALKGNMFLLRGGMFFNGAYGYGIKLHRRLYKGREFRLFDTINLEACLGSNLFIGERTLYKDVQLDLSSEKPLNRGVSFFYSFGAGYSTNETGGYLLMPVLKCGIITKF